MPAGRPDIRYAFWAPKGTPPEIKAKLNAAVVAGLADPAVYRHLTALGPTVLPREQQTPAALAAYQKAEIERWWPTVKAANMKAE